MDQSCAVCSSALKTGENLLRCFGLCKRSYHPKCVNISSRDYQVILNLGNLKWFCDICNHQSELYMDLSRQFNDFKISFNTQLDDFKKSLDVECSNADLKLNERTYSEVAKDVVIIKPKTKQNSSITKEDICKNVKPASLEVGIVQIKNIKVIKCYKM
ncbi:zinc finger fyve/phd-type [Holotrichia oblita]|uniref:Zinc finger fyve/phd-type n=1 Tax=Holotrichia oblita TaxID=644536 RepID=A0ACB9TQL6_HOLOL|nr:zinc finger fyve/phd-type [Holotrichia oblita]